MNVHPRSRLTLETTADTPAGTKGQAGACPDRTRTIPASCGASFMIRKYTEWSIPSSMHTWFCVTQLRQVALL